MKTIRARDLSPLEGLKRKDEDWLRGLAVRVRASEHVVRFGSAADDPEPIVSRAYDGTWRAGRYVGSITFEGRRLEIEPRLAPKALRDLLRTALNVIIPMRSGQLERSGTVVPLLLAVVWCRELDTATRHGLPFLRLPEQHEGPFVRGRIEESRTRQLRQRGEIAVASTSSTRSLDNDIARTLVCGQRALTHMLGGDGWMTSRAGDVMPHLWSAVGTRPKLPSGAAVRTIRYTPIRRSFRPLVEHSWELARGRGLRGAGEGEAEGLLIDMAELWERYVLTCAQRASEPGEEVTHEATAKGEDRHLFRSLVDADTTMGRLLPDVVVRRAGRVTAILDAKYKLIGDRAEAPMGIAREDRYQLAGYLTAQQDAGVVGMLVYPAELGSEGNELPPDRWQRSSGEEKSPWRGPSGTTASFSRVSFDPDTASSQLRRALSIAAQSAATT